LLLYPITLSSTTLYQYLNEGKSPRLPGGFKDISENGGDNIVASQK
jgi:hypothetical protein